jgi:hypothetical protein
MMDFIDELNALDLKYYKFKLKKSKIKCKNITSQSSFEMLKIVELLKEYDIKYKVLKNYSFKIVSMK